MQFFYVSEDQCSVFQDFQGSKTYLDVLNNFEY